MHSLPQESQGQANFALRDMGVVETTVGVGVDGITGVIVGTTMTGGSVGIDGGW